jgi:hypothetical protein
MDTSKMDTTGTNPDPNIWTQRKLAKEWMKHPASYAQGKPDHRSLVQPQL